MKFLTAIILTTTTFTALATQTNKIYLDCNVQKTLIGLGPTNMTQDLAQFKIKTGELKELRLSVKDSVISDYNLSVKTDWISTTEDRKIVSESIESWDYFFENVIPSAKRHPTLDLKIKNNGTEGAVITTIYDNNTVNFNGLEVRKFGTTTREPISFEFIPRSILDSYSFIFDKITYRSVKRVDLKLGLKVSCHHSIQ